MIFTIGDIFKYSERNLIHIIDSINGELIYYHSIGEYNTIPNSEIKTHQRFNELFEFGIIFRVTSI